MKIKKYLRFIKRDLVVKNVFKTRHDKSVLLSYLNMPFIRAVNSHSNVLECIEIAKVFGYLGYNVDVVNYDCRKKIDYGFYDVVFGFGLPFRRSILTDKKIRRIFYGTERHIYFHNKMSLRRIEDVYIKTGKWLISSSRFHQSDYSDQICAADCLVLVGGKDVERTYEEYTSKPIYSISVSYNKVADFNSIIADKDFSKAKSNYIFFSGSGLIHKGLDLLLDYFSARPDLHLHICANLDSEKEFKSLYYEKLYNFDNIHSYGFLDVDSDKFKEIISLCAFSISPSCSEGEPSSIVTLMANAGIIPLVTRESSINIEEGIIIKDYNIKAVNEAINIACSMSEDDIKAKSLSLAEKIIKNNSLDNFSQNMHRIINKILK